jgi:hypothetical protein
MNVLVACEFSGVVRDAFRSLGHNAWSCDLLPAPGSHIVGDAIDIAYNPFYEWDLMIAHPPCTYLCSSGLHWNKGSDERQAKTEEALVFVQRLMNAPIDKICVENPVGCISTRIRKPDQYIQPYEFGHDASKKTGLWLKNLPKLKKREHIPPRIVNGRERWSNQTDSGQNKLPPSKDRWKLRSVTPQGIADAMADQWGGKE